jgi:hypothetical protein
MHCSSLAFTLHGGREGWFPKKWVEVLERRKSADEDKKVV